ncbi:hypothetical protein APE_0954a [Aeropyrum pernix K1]|uniref:Uncharacterized protein n=1 Tax=Aeropyrum pernix (strain ATCC 700893 / DSM 11879 / JCM 9820 / NBRC 100138 / K1) TaxID=272557 RepID=Q05E37_AERPE|nr:hypothetical protein APE_0954a [Aeropyrum pernix K1]
MPSCNKLWQVVSGTAGFITVSPGPPTEAPGGFPREPRGHRVRFMSFKPYKFYWGFPNMSYITKRYGLDRHSTSAYLIALRGIERYSPIQKVTA